MPKLTHTETMVGRRLPPNPKHLDTYLARYVKADGTFCGKMTPGETWLRPAHKRARHKGWVRYEGVSFGKGMEIWYLTANGQTEALAAVARVKDALEARAQWGRDLDEAYRRQRQTASLLSPSGQSDHVDL